MHAPPPVIDIPYIARACRSRSHLVSSRLLTGHSGYDQDKLLRRAPPGDATRYELMCLYPDLPPFFTEVLGYHLYVARLIGELCAEFPSAQEAYFLLSEKNEHPLGYPVRRELSGINYYLSMFRDRSNLQELSRHVPASSHVYPLQPVTFLVDHSFYALPKEVTWLLEILARRLRSVTDRLERMKDRVNRYFWIDLLREVRNCTSYVDYENFSELVSRAVLSIYPMTPEVIAVRSTNPTFNSSTCNYFNVNRFHPTAQLSFEDSPNGKFFGFKIANHSPVLVEYIANDIARREKLTILKKGGTPKQTDPRFWFRYEEKQV